MCMTSDNNLLVRIARLYYEHGVNQNEIAEICNIERSRVSRLLMQARNLGIVQFHVVDPSEREDGLIEKLREAFQLKQAIVYNTLEVPEHQLKKTIGLVAADYLNSVLKEGDIFAISWGETIYYTIQGLDSEATRNLTVVPAVGGSGLISPAYQINEMARVIAEKLGGITRTLYAPAFVDSKEAQDAIRRSQDIQAITELWKNVTTALVGIGKSPFSYRSQVEGELQFGQFYLSMDEQDELRNLGVAGDINARFFGKDGRELPASIHERIIGMRLEDLHRVPLVIGVAGGRGKIEAITSALAGGNLDVLITDSLTARELVKNVEPAFDKRKEVLPT